MAYKIGPWSQEDVAFDIVPEDTSDPVVTAKVRVPGGTLVFMGEPEEVGRTLVVRGMHVQSEGVGPNGVGIHNLRLIAAIVMERLGYDEIRVEGEVRTTGANPGRRPDVLRFARGRVPKPRPGHEPR